MKIKIGLDARTIFSSTPTGVGKTLTSLYKRIFLLEPSWEFYLYSYLRGPQISDIFPYNQNIKKREIDIKVYWRFGKWEVIWMQVFLPIAIWKDNINLFHHTFGLSYYAPCAKIITIYDLWVLRFAVGYQQKKIKSFYRPYEWDIKNAKKIITISEYTKKEILDTFGMQYKNKIDVIYLAPEDNYHPLQDESSLEVIKKKYSIIGPYIFAFGQYIRRKNTQRLLESFSIFIKKVKKDVQLVVAGMRDYNSLEYLRNLTKELDIENRVIFTGFIPEEDMPFLLSGAEFLAFVSLYEGFGVSPLEAMACDCPVIASNVTSIPEIVGDAAILVNPYDVNEIADAMVSLFNNSQLRKELIEKGRERIKLFSWDRVAKETLRIYRETL